MARCSTPPSSSGRFQQTLRKRGIQPATAVREFVKSDQFDVVYVVGFSVHLAMTAFGAKRPLTPTISEAARNELMSKQLGQRHEGGSVRLTRLSGVSISSRNKVKSMGFVNNPVAPPSIALFGSGPPFGTNLT